MTISRKLEALSGLLFSASVIAYVCLVDFPLATRTEEINHVFTRNYWSEVTFLVLIAWAVGVPAGSYLHAAKGSYIGLGLIFMLAGFYLLLTLLVIVLGPAFKGHHWTAVAPSFFALSTIAMAIFNTALNPRKAYLSNLD